MCNSYNLPMNKQGVSRVSLKQATACFLFVHRLPSTLFLNNRMGWCTHVFSSLEPYADLLVSPSLHLCDHVTLKEKKGGIKKPQKKKMPAGPANTKVPLTVTNKMRSCQKGCDGIKRTILTGHHESIWWVVSDECSHFIVTVFMCDGFCGLLRFLTVP